MPNAHGFTVHLETAAGQKFAEYGHQNLHGPVARSKAVSTKIQAKDGQKFCIAIDVDHSFPYPEKGNRTLASPGKQPVRTGSGVSRYNLRSSFKQEGSSPEKEDRALTITHSEGALTLQQNPSGKLPFNFVAWVFIDGNEIPECSQILYTGTDRSLSEKITLKGRYTAAYKNRTAGGAMQDIVIQEWVFTPVGIDVLLSKMDIAAADPDPPASAIEEEMDEMVQGLAEVNAVKRNKPGQIEVRITRIVDLGRGPKSDWSRDEEESAEEDDAEATHTVAVCKPQRKMRVKACAWEPYDRTEEYYAKFIFQYMGIEKLVNFGLCTPDGKPIKQQAQPKANVSPISSLANSGASQSSSMKRFRGLNKSSGAKGKSGGWSLLSDEEEHDTGDTSSSSEESDRPRKRHGSVISNAKSRTFKKLTGSRKNKPRRTSIQGRSTNLSGSSASSLSLIPDANHDAARRNWMELVSRAEQDNGGAEDHGSEPVESGEAKDNWSVPGNSVPEYGGEDNIE